MEELLDYAFFDRKVIENRGEGFSLYKGKKVNLKGLELTQLAVIHNWMNDFEIIKSLMRINPSITCFTEQWYESVHTDNSKLILAIHDNDTNNFIGCIGLNNIEWIDRKAEMYIYIGEREYWNRGYGIDSINTMLEYVFNYYNVHKVYLHIREDNLPAINLYKKAGFQVEGKFKNDKYIDGKYINVIRMAILKDDYIR